MLLLRKIKKKFIFFAIFFFEHLREFYSKLKKIKNRVFGFRIYIFYLNDIIRSYWFLLSTTFFLLFKVMIFFAPLSCFYLLKISSSVYHNDLFLESIDRSFTTFSLRKKSLFYPFLNDKLMKCYSSPPTKNELRKDGWNISLDNKFKSIINNEKRYDIFFESKISEIIRQERLFGKREKAGVEELNSLYNSFEDSLTRKIKENKKLSFIFDWDEKKIECFKKIILSPFFSDFNFPKDIRATDFFFDQIFSQIIHKINKSDVLKINGAHLIIKKYLDSPSLNEEVLKIIPDSAEINFDKLESFFLSFDDDNNDHNIKKEINKIISKETAFLIDDLIHKYFENIMFKTNFLECFSKLFIANNNKEKIENNFDQKDFYDIFEDYGYILNDYKSNFFNLDKKINKSLSSIKRLIVNNFRWSNSSEEMFNIRSLILSLETNYLESLSIFCKRYNNFFLDDFTNDIKKLKLENEGDGEICQKNIKFISDFITKDKNGYFYNKFRLFESNLLLYNDYESIGNWLRYLPMRFIEIKDELIFQHRSFFLTNYFPFISSLRFKNLFDTWYVLRMFSYDFFFSNYFIYILFFFLNTLLSKKQFESRDEDIIVLSYSNDKSYFSKKTLFKIKLLSALFLFWIIIFFLFIPLFFFLIFFTNISFLKILIISFYALVIYPIDLLLIHIFPIIFIFFFRINNDKIKSILYYLKASILEISKVLFRVNFWYIFPSFISSFFLKEKSNGDANDWNFLRFDKTRASFLFSENRDLPYAPELIMQPSYLSYCSFLNTYPYGIISFFYSFISFLISIVIISKDLLKNKFNDFFIYFIISKIMKLNFLIAFPKSIFFIVFIFYLFSLYLIDSKSKKDSKD